MIVLLIQILQTCPMECDIDYHFIKTSSHCDLYQIILSFKYMLSSSDLSVKFVNIALSNNNKVGLIKVRQRRCDLSISIGWLRLEIGDLWFIYFYVFHIIYSVPLTSIFHFQPQILYYSSCVAYKTKTYNLFEHVFVGSCMLVSSYSIPIFDQCI